METSCFGELKRIITEGIIEGKCEKPAKKIERSSIGAASAIL